MIDPKIQEQLRAKYNPDGSLLRNIQLRELEILKAIDKICRKHSIKYWLSSGTLLGAVRHGGFIPWDDDVDIEMLKQDYKKFCQISKEEFEAEGIILHNQESDPSYLIPHAKVRDLFSWVEEPTPYSKNYKYKGLWVDVFVMDKATPLKIYNISNILQFKILYKCCSIQSKILRKLSVSFCNILIHKIIFPILNLFSISYKKGLLRHVLGTGMPKLRYINDVKETKLINFEGYKFYAPGNIDNYLSSIFGDYEKIPNINSIIKFHFEVISIDSIPNIKRK